MSDEEIVEEKSLRAICKKAHYPTYLGEDNGAYHTVLQWKFFLDLYRFPDTDEDDDGAAGDSPWSMIQGVMKYFRMSYEEVVFNRSYMTVVLLNRSIPSYKTDNEDDKADKPVHVSEYFMKFM